MDKKEVLLERNKISRLLGTETQDDNLERNIFLLKSLDMQKDIAAVIGKVYTLIRAGQEDTQSMKDVKNEIRVLVEALDKYQEAFDKEVKVLVSNFPPAVKEVKISNTEDFKHEHPKEIRVSNLKEIKPEKHPDEISIKRPVWYKELDFDKLFKFSKDSSVGFFNQVKASIFNSFIKNAKPKEAIPVRLVTEDGEKFYRAGNVFVGGGGGTDPVGVKNIAGTKINPATEDGNLAVILGRLDITLSTLRDAITAASPNNKTLNDLYGKLEALLAELQQKTEPADNQQIVIQGLIERIVFNTLKRLNVDSSGRLRVSSEATVISSGTVTTLTTLTNLTNWGLFTATVKSQIDTYQAYQQGFRRNLVVS